MAKKSAKKTVRRASPRRAARSEFRAAALVGRAVRGHEWDPAQPLAQAPALPEINEPRPYRTRYPISNEEFESLKSAAPKAKLAKVTAQRAKDSPQAKTELSAGPMAAAALEPGLEPVAAPTGSANFAGIAATGWLPPDCTMAVGPQHVLLSVNSSLAIHSKAGGVALL